MIKKYSLLMLQTAINHALSLDDDIEEKLAVLQGKTLCVVVEPLNISFYMQFCSKNILLLSHIHTPVDATIKTSPLGLIRLSILPVSKVRSLFNDSVILEGDAEFGQQVKQLFDKLDIDWEGCLANLTGDVVAHRFGSLMRKGLHYNQRLYRSFKRQTQEYLQDEINMVVGREELDDFFYEVDTLTLAIERLEARIQLSVRSMHADN